MTNLSQRVLDSAHYERRSCQLRSVSEDDAVLLGQRHMLLFSVFICPLDFMSLFPTISLQGRQGGFLLILWNEERQGGRPDSLLPQPLLRAW
jgi:hypothetical protein